MGRKSKIIGLTDEQIAYRNSILRKARKNKVVPVQEIMHYTKYINNCIYWINEYYAARASKGKALSAINSMQSELQKLKKEIEAAVLFNI